MASKDLYDNIKVASTVVPAVNAANVTGTTVDQDIDNECR